MEIGDTQGLGTPSYNGHSISFYYLLQGHNHTMARLLSFNQSINRIFVKTTPKDFPIEVVTPYMLFTRAFKAKLHQSQTRGTLGTAPRGHLVIKLRSLCMGSSCSWEAWFPFQLHTLDIHITGWSGHAVCALHGALAQLWESGVGDCRGVSLRNDRSLLTWPA